MPAKLHQRTAKWVNRLDGVMGRKVWHNVWETRLTREKSYPARLHCVHRNAVRLAAFKLRARYRDLLRESILRTVTTPEEAEEELAHLRRLFCD